MSRIEQTYERIINYLKDLLSNRERHDLEQEMMRDAFDEEAFEGLNQLSANELESDMDVMLTTLHDRIETHKKRNLILFYRIAATIILLVGIGSILYVVFRTPARNLITEKTSRLEKSAPAEIVSPAGQDSSVMAISKFKDARASKKETPVLAENHAKSPVAEKSVAVAMEIQTETIAEFNEVQAIDEAEQILAETPAAISKKQPDAIVIQGNSSNTATAKMLTAKVVDSQGQPLPGVNVLVKGTTHGTLTDMDGDFALQATDTSPVLTFSYIGFKPLELNGNEIAGKEITLTEDLVALNEVVVTVYGTARRSVLSGTAAGVEVKDKSGPDEPTPYNYIKPVPAGGSLKAFKKWVDDRLDYSAFKAYRGKQRILVSLTVQTNGTISNIRISETVPAVIAGEFKKVLAQSPPWKPAFKDDTPVEAQVEIRFVISIE
jgi:hypothetical protein